MKFANVDFELFVADYYKNKVESCKARGVEWKLSLVSVRNLLRTVNCPYTGAAMTMPRPGKGTITTDITIDRIDNKQGYVPGNVMACSSIANNFKSMFENPQYPISMKTAERMLGKMQRRIIKSKRGVEA
jgi:hypothetical protein